MKIIYKKCSFTIQNAFLNDVHKENLTRPEMQYKYNYST